MKKTPTLAALLIAGAVTAACVSRIATPGAQIAVPNASAPLPLAGEAVVAPAVAEVAGALDAGPSSDQLIDLHVLGPSSAIALVDEPVSRPGPSVAIATEPETNSAAAIRMSNASLTRRLFPPAAGARPPGFELPPTSWAEDTDGLASAPATKVAATPT